MVAIVSFWTRLMRKQWTMAFVMLLLFVSTLPLAAAASPKSSYPTAGKTVYVISVQSKPRSADVGTTVVTTVAVSYEPKGFEMAEVPDPVTLSPETISFRWVSSAGEKVVENAPVVPTDRAGVYEYTQTVGDDFPTGTVTISVVAGSCSDGQGNSGPPTDVDSHLTTFENDNSIVQIGAVQQAATQDLLAVYAIPIVIAIVVILAVLLLVLRRRKKKT